MTSTTVQMATETTVVQVVDGEATVVQTGVPVTVTTTGGGGGVTDHGALTGLADDDHTQYHNDARGDARYQPLDSDLTAIAALSTTSFGRSLLALADAAALRTAAAVGTVSTLASDTDGTLAANSDSNVATQKATKTYADLKLAKASNLSDVANAATAFGNIKQAASDSATGVVELATAAETTTGTDATRAVTPDGLAGSEFGVKLVEIMASDMTTAITTGDGKAGFMVPASMNGMNLVRAHAALLGAQSSSGTPTVQLRRVRSGSAADMLSTKITIDANESTSHTAATAPVIDTANDDAATADLIYVDVDVAGTGAKGLLVTLEFQLP